MLSQKRKSEICISIICIIIAIGTVILKYTSSDIFECYKTWFVEQYNNSILPDNTVKDYETKLIDLLPQANKNV